MKLPTIIVLVLAFGPSLLDCVLRQHNVPALTPVFATRTFTDAVIACKPTVQVPPTAVLVPDHNKEKNFSIDSTISISTESQLTTSISKVASAFAFKLTRRIQTLWNRILHRREHGLGRLIDGIVVFYLYLWTFFAVGLALLQNRALQHPELTPEPVVQFEGPRAHVAWIELDSIEGLLLIYSYTTTSPKTRDQWKGLWVPRRRYTYYLSNGPANREVLRIAADSTLFDILLQTVSTYRPWAAELAGAFLASQGRCLTSEPAVQFGSIFGRGPPAQVVKEVVSTVVTPRRERVLVDWIEIPSHEGALILYGYSIISTGRPTEWTCQWFPRQPHTYYLSDRPTNLNSLLLNILLHSISIYHPWAPQLAGVLLDFTGEVFEETGIAAATDSAIEVEVAATLCHIFPPNTPDPSPAIDTPTTSMTVVDDSLDMEWEATGPLLEDMGNADHSYTTEAGATSTLLPPSFQSVLTCIEEYSFPVPSQPASLIPEVPNWSTSLPGPPSASSGALPSFGYNTAGYQHFPTIYPAYPAPATYDHAPMVYQPYPYGTSATYRQTPRGHYPYTTPAAHQPTPTVYHQYPDYQVMWQPVTAERATPACEAMRPSLPLLEDRASQRNDSGFWAPGLTGFEEEATEENELEEAPKKKFRRGGKRQTARKLKWEELERQRRGKGDPEAGPSRLT